jgi:predicted Rossmann-fold nucleotide-binding protein
VNGYFDHLIKFFDHGVNEWFVREEHRKNIIVSDNAVELIEMLNAYQPVHIGKWIEEIKEESTLN